MRSMLLVTVVVLAASPAAAKLKVVTTTQCPAALTRAVGGDRVEVTTLSKGFQDPHFLEAKPSYIVQLHRADLFEVIGLDLEIGYLGPLISGSRNEAIQPGRKGYLDLSQFIQPLEVAEHVDRGHGDVHPGGNPHYWLDPENGRRMARAIAARLTDLDPAGKAVYGRNLAAFEKELTARQAEWKRRLAPLANQPIVTYHRSWSYFARRFGLEVVDYVEPKPGIPPSAAHTLHLLKSIPARGVKIILMESFYDRRVPDLLADKTGARVVMVPNSVGGDEGVETYFDLFERITSELNKVAG